MGVSLWLIPPAHMRQKFKEIMDNPMRFGAVAPLDRFEPHITLTTIDSSDPNYVKILRDVIPKIGKTSVRVDFDYVGMEETYFRSCFLQARSTPELELLMTKINEALGIMEPPPKFPHQSVFYVPDERSRERTVLTSTLGGGIGSQQLKAWSYDATHIAIAFCDGECKDWKILECIPLVRPAFVNSSRFSFFNHAIPTGIIEDEARHYRLAKSMSLSSIIMK
ncbi:hypothetical protein SCHPADRAFT_512062 [Schizopora paradoxa]|uniref:LigT-like protein n=1 Tax=Schizopora paradoxa TaxID=27342 RepID=A0A0H2RM41_9AGAM|nr:hypothetical protein SCHPADRAFT_512062 [Schizopora paradoxa]